MNEIGRIDIVDEVRFLDPNGIPQVVSVSRLEKGSTGQLEYRGRPLLVRQISVAMEQRLNDTTRRTAARNVSALALFWRMLDEYEIEMARGEGKLLEALSRTGTPEVNGLEASVSRIEGLSDLPYHTWHLFDYYLRGAVKSRPAARTRFSFVRDLIEDALRIAGSKPLCIHHLPESSAGPRIHADLDYEALRWLHKICIAEIRRADNLPLRKLFEDEPFDCDASAPDDWTEAEAGCRQMVFQDLRGRVLGKDRLLPISNYGFRERDSRQRAERSGIKTQKLSDYLDTLAPDKPEVLAAWVLVAGRTGWLDALSNLDLARHWVDEIRPTSAGGRPKPRFFLSARRPKSGGFQTYTSTCGRFSPYRVIKRMEERTRFLREISREKLVLLQNQERPHSDEELREIARLEKLVGNPFAYLPRGGPTTNATKIVSLFDDVLDGYRDAVGTLIGRVGMHMLGHVDDKVRENLVHRIKSIKLSDLRDAAADRVWDKTRSLYAVQAQLGHSHISVTAAYQNRRQKRLEAFLSFANVMGVLGSEVEAGEGINPSVLHARILLGQEATIPPAVREKLRKGTLPRGRVGVPCADPNDPPSLGKAESQTSRCTLDLCVICRHGIIIDDVPGVFEALARRLATLRMRLASMPISDVSGSLEDYESVRIHEVLNAYYRGRHPEFEELVARFEREGACNESQ